MSDVAAAPRRKLLPPELELRVQRADDALLAQIIEELVQTDTDWNWSNITFDLVEQPITAFTVHDADTQQLVASAVLAAPARDCTTSWVGFVVVARNVRRRGVGTCVMRSVIEHARLRDDVQRVELLATEQGAPLYESVGFTAVADMHVCLMQLDTHKQQRFEIVHDALILTHVPRDVREQAVKLYSSVDGGVKGNRTHMVETLCEHGSCVLARRDDGAIQAIAWIRRVQNKSVETWWLGPLISHHIGATESLIRASIRHAQQHSQTAQSRVQTMCLNSQATFEQMHFGTVAHVPLMQRETTTATRPRRAQRSARTRATSSAPHTRARYVALCSYHAS